MNREIIKERLDNERAQQIWKNLDFGKHDGIIDASAGTGKTYTLQSIVLKLVVDKCVDSVKNILLVTYTEKAAGELRDRIRKVLEEAKLPLDDFDEMSICTIHSFCHELLTEYAFENRVAMQTEILGSDKELKAKAFHDAVRSDEYAKKLREIGEGVCFTTLMKEAEIGSIDQLIKIANNHFDATEKLCEEGTDEKIVVTAQLVNRLLPIAREKFALYKVEATGMTFDDIIEKASEVIKAESEKEFSSLIEAIRRKYRIALVDEFQDTDAKQWTIFKTVFSSEFNKNVKDAPKPQQGFLLVVGDPKQAIYSFRGADVGTYMQAKGDIIKSHAPSGSNSDSIQPAAEFSPTASQSAYQHTLDTTYRSSSDLVNAFNTFFGTDSGWFTNMTEGGANIAYTQVKFAEASSKFKGFTPGDGFGSAVTLLESLPEQLQDPSSRSWKSGYGNNGMCLPIFMQNAAREMIHLVHLDPAFTLTDKDGKIVPHRFAYRDMCVLVRSRNDARVVAEELTKHHIPYTFYKERGLYNSIEAESVLALLEFLSDSGRRGRYEALLLTPIFAVQPYKIEADAVTDDKAISSIIDHWKELAQNRKWSELFESVMNDSHLAQTSQSDFGYNRRWMAFRQIFDQLLVARGSTARTIGDFCEALRSLRNNDRNAGDDDGSIRQRESDADCVQIITMHSSKGLEFKVVFVASGFNQIVAGLNNLSDEQKATLREEKRLFYVALTRAEFKLYLPWSQWAAHKRGNNSEIGIGSVGSALLPNVKQPEFGFLANAIGKFASEEVQVVAHNDAENDEPPKCEGVRIQEYEEPGWLGAYKLQWDSYSSLVKHGGKAAKGERYADTLLQRGAIAGDVFHAIMEQLCKGNDTAFFPGFKSIGGCATSAELEQLFDAPETENAFVRLVRQSMSQHGLRQQIKGDDTTEKTLARMAWHALNTPITIGELSFKLKDIEQHNRRAEFEFAVDEHAIFGDGLPPREGLFNGMIDLLVRPRGAAGPVVVIDWKTNSLPCFTDPEIIQQTMIDSGFNVQYELYSLAVNHWLGANKLCGVVYLFVRGGEVRDATDGVGRSGIYVQAVDDAFLAYCRDDVQQKLMIGEDNEG